jgi:hypothetical protein
VYNPKAFVGQVVGTIVPRLDTIIGTIIPELHTDVGQVSPRHLGCNLLDFIDLRCCILPLRG